MSIASKIQEWLNAVLLLGINKLSFVYFGGNCCYAENISDMLGPLQYKWDIFYFPAAYF